MCVQQRRLALTPIMPRCAWQEKLYEAINAKKLAVAQQQQQQQQGVEGTADAAGQQRRGKPVKGARGGPGKTPLGIRCMCGWPRPIRGLGGWAGQLALRCPPH